MQCFISSKIHSFFTGLFGEDFIDALRWHVRPNNLNRSSQFLVVFEHVPFHLDVETCSN